MKRRSKYVKMYSIIFLVFIGFNTNCKSQVNSNSQANDYNGDRVENSSIKKNEKETFEKFLLNFSYNENFQKSRIKFPVLYIHLNEDFTKHDTTYLKLEDWKYSNLGFEQNTEYRGQIYDNFNHELKDTDERVYAIHGIRDGVERYYYFKRINSLWYLIKYEDLST